MISWFVETEETALDLSVLWCKKARSFNHSGFIKFSKKLLMAQMNLIVHERKTQGQRAQTSRGGASYFYPRGLWGILYTDTSRNQKGATVNQMWSGRGENLIYLVILSGVLYLFCCDSVKTVYRCWKSCLKLYVHYFIINQYLTE